MSFLIKIVLDNTSWLVAGSVNQLKVFKLNSLSELNLVTQIELDANIVQLCSLEESGFIFLITENHEWAIVSLSLDLVSQGSFPTSIKMSSVHSVIFQNKASILVLIAWNCIQFTLVTVFNKHFPPKVKLLHVTANERIHWPLGNVRGLCILKGSNTKHFTVIKEIGISDVRFGY